MSARALILTIQTLIYTQFKTGSKQRLNETDKDSSMGQNKMAGLQFWEKKYNTYNTIQLYCLCVEKFAF